MERNTYWFVVLRDSCDEDYVCYEQVNDEIFVDCVAVALHRPAVQQTFTAIARALICSAAITHINYTKISTESVNSSFRNREKTFEIRTFDNMLV